MRPLRALLLAALLAGCYAPPPPPPPEPGTVEATVLGAFPRGSELRWHVLLQNGRNDTLAGVEVSLSVSFRDVRPGGANETRIDLAPQQQRTVALDTWFLGTGDYRYDLVVRDAQGRELARESQMYEMCFC